MHNDEMIEAWENGEVPGDDCLPASAKHMVKVEKALKMRAISLRLPEQMIRDLRFIALREGLGYQPLMRTVLHRFIESEFRNMAYTARTPPAISSESDDVAQCA